MPLNRRECLTPSYSSVTTACPVMWAAAHGILFLDRYVPFIFDICPLCLLTANPVSPSHYRAVRPGAALKRSSRSVMNITWIQYSLASGSQKQN